MLKNFNSGIQCLALIARFHQIPAEPSALIREFQHEDESLADINLIRAAKSLSFKAKFIQDKADEVPLIMNLKVLFKPICAVSAKAEPYLLLPITCLR